MENNILLNKNNEYHRDRYEGEWDDYKDDKREGKGIFYYNNG